MRYAGLHETHWLACKYLHASETGKEIQYFVQDIPRKIKKGLKYSKKR